MGNRVSTEIARLLSERKLLKANISKDIILKEIESAQTDLQDAQDSLQQNKFKWATIQGYYSIFHSTRALLFSKGFREKSHYALLLAMRELFPKELGSSLMLQFEEAMGLRQEADYGLKFSETGAIDTIDSGASFLKKSKKFSN